MENLNRIFESVLKESLLDPQLKVSIEKFLNQPGLIEEYTNILKDKYYNSNFDERGGILANELHCKFYNENPQFEGREPDTEEELIAEEEMFQNFIWKCKKII